MFTKITDKKQINKLKSEFETYSNTMNFQYNTPEFSKLREISYKNKEFLTAFHNIEFPCITDTKGAFELSNVSWMHKTYRIYKIWALDYKGLTVLISYNSDRGTDYYVPKNTDTKLVYDMLYDLQKTVYEYSGNTNFEKYYPKWEEL